MTSYVKEKVNQSEKIVGRVVSAHNALRKAASVREILLGPAALRDGRKLLHGGYARIICMEARELLDRVVVVVRQPDGLHLKGEALTSDSRV